ncbi:hypothetical protein PTNB73_03638 [Pyrenophora teres f. teres]|nr:hypothetical protein PTNB73_03638 [Pyrenophora teres f. teres]
MITPRHLYNTAPPDRRTRLANNPTLLYSWWCTVFSAVIIAVRLTGRYMRNERLFREDKIMALSIIPLFARMGFVHVVLIYGTNNVDVSELTDPIVIDHREIGSRMVLGARIFYAMFIWMAKFTVSEFLKRLTERFWKKGYEWGLRGIRIFLALTFVMVIISTLAECRPISHYWQVKPDPGPQCRQGYAQLLTMGITDIVTDIFLIAFPIPIIVRSSMPLKRKISLTALFSLSIILVIVTGTRMPLVIGRQGLQQFRTVFASSEILAAAIVANAIILGSFLRDRGVKKPKFKAPSTTDSMERRGSTRRFTDQTCSSDEDLARSLGYRTKPELLEKPSNVPRPAPVADLDLLSSGRQPNAFANNNWNFPDEESSTLQDHESSSITGEDIRDPMPSPRCGRRVSWFDVGGLLDNQTLSSSPTDSVIAHDFATRPRRGSRASNTIMSNGRAFLPQVRRNSRLSQQSEDYEMSVRPTHQLQDLGGLLSEDREQEEAQSNASPYSGSSSVGHSIRYDRTATIHRTSTRSTRASYDVPSLQDAGGLLSGPPPTSIRRTTTRQSRDMPSLQDAGGLLS